MFDFDVRTWTEPNYACKGPSQVKTLRDAADADVQIVRHKP